MSKPQPSDRTMMVASEPAARKWALGRERQQPQCAKERERVDGKEGGKRGTGDKRGGDGSRIVLTGARGVPAGAALGELS